MSNRAWAALAAVYVIWGSTYLGIELAGETIPAIFAAGGRFVAAGALLAGWVVWRKGRAAFRIARAELLAACLVGVLLLSANGMLFLAERHVPIGLASLLIASVPLWILLFRAAAGDRPRLLALASVGTGFCGIALLVRPSGHTSLGWLLVVLGSACVWATGSFVSSRLKLPDDALVATAIEMTAGGLLLLPLGFVLADRGSLDPATWSGRSIGGLVYLVLIGSLVGYTAYVWLLGNVPIGTVATYAYVNPVVAILLGVVVLHEGVSWRIGGGALIVLCSVAVVIRQEHPAGAGA